MNNYIKYLQAGGAATDPIEQVYAALMQDPKGTLKLLDSMGEEGKQILQALLQKHPELQQVLGGVPQEEKGGEVPKAENGTNTETIVDQVYIPSTAKTRIPRYAANLEGRQFPAGSVSTAAVYDPTDYTTYTRNIIYGTTPAQNDTIYGVSPVGREEMSYGRGGTPSWLFDEVKTKSENAFHRDPNGIYKCGGKVKKGEKGTKTPDKKVVKRAKNGCACLLQRKGGKLVEVDSCTGEILK